MADPIVDAFTTENGLRNMMVAIGVGNNEIARIILDGLNTMEKLIGQYKFKINEFENYLKSLNKTFATASVARQRLYFSPPVMSNLTGCLFYASTCFYGLHAYVDIRNIDAARASDFYKVYEDLHDSENHDSEEIDVKVPSLKGASNWRSFRDTVLMKLSMTKGKTGFPIDYVINMTERDITHANAARVILDTIDITEDKFFETSAVHFGKHYKEDNKIVWLVLKSYLMKTPSYDLIIQIDRSSNGRKAWTILKTFYEGEDFTQRLQDEAFSILNSTAYRGETARSSFETYVTRHIKAHKLLIEADYGPQGDGMDDSTKIQHFKAGIKLEAGLEHALTSARTSGLNHGTFTQFVSFLQSEVDSKNNRKRELRASVKAVDSNKGKSKNQHDRIPSEKVDNKIVEGRHYADQDWKQLTPKQRSAVIRLQRQRRGNKNKNKKRKISSAKSSITQSDLNSLSQAIIAGMKLGESEEGDVRPDDISKVTEATSPSRKKAKSGAAGDFLSSIAALRNRK